MTNFGFCAETFIVGPKRSLSCNGFLRWIASRHHSLACCPHRAVATAVQLEGVEMVIFLAKGNLDRAVQFVERHSGRNEQPAPDHRRDAAQAHLEPINDGHCSVRHGARLSQDPPRPQVFHALLLAMNGQDAVESCLPPLCRNRGEKAKAGGA